MLDVVFGVLVFTLMILALVSVILGARALLLGSGDATVTINDDRVVAAALGTTLLRALAEAQIFVAAACGGRGTCGQCRIIVLAGGGALMPQERSHINRRESRAGQRLACQLTVREDLRVRVPDEAFGVRRWVCKVRSNRNVATFIKELVLEMPPGETMDFRAGAYVQIECPPHTLKFSDFVIDETFRNDWDQVNLWRYESRVQKSATRAYSLANYPDEKGVIMLNVRIATPPPGAPPDCPPGQVSSYLFSLQPGDEIAVQGPFGEFFAKPGDAEMVFIGGGAGMAPLRSHVFDQLKRLGSTRKISFWYGARSWREMFYADDFEHLAAEHPNFSWHVALSDPLPGDEWTGPTGFIHAVVFEQYLKDHAAPHACEYYLCGPPMMIAAVLIMLEDLGVEREQILYDEFG